MIESNDGFVDCGSDYISETYTDGIDCYKNNVCTELYIGKNVCELVTSGVNNNFVDTMIFEIT